jgi:tetratricopeptide (TPR) repeat protein
MGAPPGSPADGAALSEAPDFESGPTPKASSSRHRRRHSTHAQRSQVGRVLANVGVGFAVFLIVAAPLAAGGVHRSTMILLMAAAVVCVAALSGGLALQSRALRVGAVSIVPLVFMLIPLLQSLPLPLSFRAVLDSAGTTLLRENDVTSAWPLSLDPPTTRLYVGRAAVALVVFLCAYHLASGQTRRHLLVRAVAIAGLAAVVVGIGHRIFGVNKLYGMFNTAGRALITGPFVNVNHTAELLELAAFACLACSFQRETVLNRVGWLAGAVLCGGAALATLSRGAVLAMAVGVLVFAVLRHFGADVNAGRRRASVAWAALIIGVFALGAAALGAGQLIDRFKTDTVTTDVRFHLWRDGLRVFATHPFGIGRGAFDRVFPIYRAFKMRFPLRFAFVENEPLQLLIDCGWFLFVLLAVAFIVLIGRRLVRYGRRDKVEAALVAGLIAVLAHSVVDFGLETLGVLVPFTAVLGATMGRLRTSTPTLPATAGWSIAAMAAACALFGVAATRHRSADDFDALLKQTPNAEARRTLLVRATETHPLDYFYALSQARLLPLQGSPGAASPRLHALNRALRLCPGCDTAHVEVARNLWKLGLRRQALMEWRTAIEMQPSLFRPAVGELFMAGAKSEELAALASGDVPATVALVDFLSSQDQVKAAFAVLDQANALGVGRGELLLARAGLELKAGQLTAAQATAEAARKLGAGDVRLSLLRAQVLLGAKGDDGADEALAILDEAAARDPADLAVQIRRIELVSAYKKWNAAQRSLEGLKLALFHRDGSAAAAHIWAARIEGQMGRWNKALDEYRIALVDQAAAVSVWIEYAQAAENAGRDLIARDAYAQASRLSPNSPDIAALKQALDARLSRRLQGTGPDDMHLGSH